MSRRTGFSPDVKDAVEERAGWRCELCANTHSDMEYHHRRARGMGSTKRPETNAAANCIYLCGSCHRHVESHRTQAYDNGWLVRQSAFPADTPVLRRGVLVLLRDNGDIIPAPPVRLEAVQ